MKRILLIIILWFLLLINESYLLGQQTWVKVLGGATADNAYSIIEANNGGYIICGLTNSFSDKDFDAWVVKVDQAWNIIWQTTLGGTNFDSCNSIVQTYDGNYLLAGTTWSFGAGSSDYFITKINNNGEVIWAKTYGGTEYDFSHRVIQTNDGNYIVIGRSWSFGNSNGDIWIIKINSSGEIIWQKSYGTSYLDTSYSIIETSDNGYLITGGSWSKENQSDVIVIKINNNGDIVWQKMYGGGDFDYSYSSIQTGDSGYIIIGTTKSFGAGDSDCLIFKIDSTGNIEWQKALGGTNFDYLYTIKEVSDGNYISIGKTKSFGAGNSDILLLKLSLTGDLLNQKVYGGVAEDEGISLIEIINEGFLLIGNNNSFGLGSYDLFIIKTDNVMSLELCNIFQDISLSEYTTAMGPDNSSLIINQTNAAVNTVNFNIKNTSAISNSICPPQPTLYSFKPYVNDEDSEFANGVIEPDEIVYLEGSIANRGTEVATSVNGTLSTTDLIEIIESEATYPDIEPLTIVNCINCYKIKAPLSNRTATHWDFKATELVNCDLCNSFPFQFTFHIGNSFTDVPINHIFYKYIETILHNNITGGCTNTEYCPFAIVQRQQMAKFICRAMNVSKDESCLNNNCSGIFADVPNNNIFCADIEALYKTGIVSGCQTSPLLYCPNQYTNRQSMAKFVCNAREYIIEDSCIVSACEGIFDDVSTSNPFCGYIEALFKEGIISGCSETNYCPTANVLRGQMSKFLVNAFNLTL